MLALWLAYWPACNAAAPSPPVDLVLVVDNSNATHAVDPERQLTAQLSDVVDGMRVDTRVALIAFDDLAAPLVPLTDLAEGGRERISAELRALEFAAQHTNSAAGLERAIYELTQAARTDARRVILLQQAAPIDVGDPQRDAAFRRWAVEVLADKAAAAGIEVLVISLGAAADLNLGSMLAERTSGVAAEPATVGDLPQVMTLLRQRLALAHRPPQPLPPTLGAQPPVSQPEPTTTPSVGSSTGADATAPVAAEPPAEPPLTRVDQLENLPEPAAGPAVTLAAAGEQITDTGWRFPALTADHAAWRGLPIAALTLLLIAGLVWLARRRRRGGSLPQADAEPPAAEARLVDVSGVTGRNSYPLGGKLARISRAAGPDTDNVVTVHIPQDVISRSHAFIEVRRGSHWITDPGSNNGTFVNGERISGSRELEHGDRISFATYEFVFEHPGRVRADSVTTPHGQIDSAAAASGDAAAQAATTVYSADAADPTVLAPPSKGQAQPDAAAGTDQDPTIVRPAG